MNKEEAIDIIRQYECCKEHCEACEMAIQALSQEPCERFEWGIDGNVYKITKAKDGKEICQQVCDDAISRDMALEKMADYVASGYADSAEDFEEYSRIICQLPSVTQKSVIDDISIDLINEAKEHMREGAYNDGVRFGLMLAEQIVLRHRGTKMVEPQERIDKE